eukprot:TRINITY_DN2925_c0_g3_i1.p1 TRINITY_DN2925_c0_g3~~TRINITY_DN2925_c0_g3_i1.p1  ORF type:complete len:141 (-),score=41.91 TRINITY_DN2925_c0_g3_i1:245-667(-)
MKKELFEEKSAEKPVKEKKTLDSSLRMAHETLEASKAIERKLYEQGKTLRDIDKDCNKINKNVDKGTKIINSVKSFFSFNLFKKKKKEEKPQPLNLYEPNTSDSHTSQSNLQEKQKHNVEPTYDTQLEELHNIVLKITNQ